MQKTINYNLNKPNYSDQYDLRHWNDNMDIIDSQMKAEENARIQSDALKENVSNKVSSFQSTPDHTHYPSEKLVKDYVDDEIDDLKQDLSEGNMTVYAASHDDNDNFIRGYYEHVDRKRTSWSSTPNDTHYPSEKLVKDSLDDKENLSNKVTSFQSTPDDTHYPSEKLVFDSTPIKKISKVFYNAYVELEYTLGSFEIGELRYVNIRADFTTNNKAYFKLPSNGNYYVLPLGGFSDSSAVSVSTTSMLRYYTTRRTDSAVWLKDVEYVPGGSYIIFAQPYLGFSYLIYRVN